MIAVAGTYRNGSIKLDKEQHFEKPVRVIVTFLEEPDDIPQGALCLSHFSFSQSRAALAGYKGSLSDAVIEERRKEL